MDTLQNLTNEGACSSTLILEKTAKRKGSNQPYSTSWFAKIPSHKPTPSQSPPSKTNSIKLVSKDKTSVSKDVICLKCHGNGHYKSECPNAKAFTQREWNEIKERTGLKAMLWHLGVKEP